MDWKALHWGLLVGEEHYGLKGEAKGKKWVVWTDNPDSIPAPSGWGKEGGGGKDARGFQPIQTQPFLQGGWALGSLG